MMFLASSPHENDFTQADRNLSRRLAQWAINVVDFRDRDSIMTPFEFDVNPLNGWQRMDGDVATDEGDERDVVWGCEYPDLIITETLAYHDRRVIDSLNDSGPQEWRWIREDDEDVMGDADLDQYRIPQGRLYLELYCTCGPTTESTKFDHPKEPYDDQAHLDLGGLAPADDRDLRYPVWRVVISP